MRIMRQDGCDSNRMSEMKIQNENLKMRIMRSEFQNEILKTNFEMRILIQDVAEFGKELFAHAENGASAPK